MRGLLLIAVLTACATKDVLRSEPIAERAVCGGGVGIFGRPHGIPACADGVVNLGDGCYAVRKDGQRSLVECAANAPDGHVMCLVDPRGELPVFAEDRMQVWWRVWLPKEPFGAVTKTGRCRDRYRTWVANREPRARSPVLVATGWSSYSGRRILGTVPDVTFVPDEDPVALDRMVPSGIASARICPREPIELTFPSKLPARFAHRLRAAVEQAFAGIPVRGCDVIGFRIALSPILARSPQAD